MIEKTGPPASLVGPRRRDAFTSLVKSVVGQQLSVKAAATIFSRVQDCCACQDSLDPEEPGAGERVSPREVLARSEGELRSAGLSGRKVEYVRDLATKFSKGHLSDAKLDAMTGDEVMQALIQVKGLGEWSVNMFQMFHLREADVLPVGDLGVRKGAHALYAKGSKGSKGKGGGAMSKEDLAAIGEKWRPFRSVGAFYMWRAKDFLDQE